MNALSESIVELLDRMRRRPPSRWALRGLLVLCGAAAEIWLLLVAGAGPFLDVDRPAATAFGNQAALALEVARAQDDQRRLALFEERDRIARAIERALASVDAGEMREVG